MQSVLISNAKGGCGKTTIATNLASAFRQQGYKTAIADVDPQKSSLQWLDRRPSELPDILALDWSNGIGKVKKSIERLVIDAPAGLTASDFQSLLKMADGIVIPILPSTFDQIAAMAFLSKIETLKPIRKNKKQVAIVANRVRPRSRSGRALTAFLEGFNQAPLMTLRDTVIYVDAAETGCGLFDRTDRQARIAQEDWRVLLAHLAATD